MRHSVRIGGIREFESPLPDQSINACMTQVEVKCGHCACDIVITLKKRNYYAKHSWQHYCSKECRDAVSITWCPVCGGEKKASTVTCSYACSNTFFRRGPRANATQNYRTIAFTHHDKECVVCRENKIVEVHHLNGNHDDNRPENLVPLCPTHHKYWHSKWRCLIEDKVKAYQEGFFERLIMETQDDCDLRFGELGEAPEVEF